MRNTGKTGILKKNLMKKGAGRMSQPVGHIRWLRDLLCGVLLGAGAILPGVSGGVLAVVFGIYGPFMELLTRPRMVLPKYWRWLPPLAIGWCLGFLESRRALPRRWHCPRR